MNPIIFKENSTSWDSNGIGRLSDAISCKVTEQRNGIYELEMVYPTTGRRFEDISIRRIIAVKPAQGKSIQPFRIYKISRPIHGKVTISAQHLSYDLTKYVAKPFQVTAATTACKSTLQMLKARSFTWCPFNFETDVTTVASYTQKIPASIRQRLGGIEGSVLDQFGGEYEWDGYTVRLLKKRGEETNYTLRYGKNITDVTQDENIANTATGVVPFWLDAGGDDVVYGDVVYNTQLRGNYSTPLVVPLDLSGEWEEAPTQEQLSTAATVYVNKSGFGIPKVSIKVSFINLAETEEYKDIAPLQSVNLCDTVKVQFEELGIDTTAKVVETVYDVLAERYESIQVGSLRSNLASAITDIEAGTVQSISDTGQRVFAQAGNAAQDMVNNATRWLTSGDGYVVAVKNDDGSWKEMLFMDTDDVTTAKNVLRINQNGLGFSSTGVGGPYTQAWTLDGKLVVGGTNVPSMTCYDSNGNILFQVSKDGIIWDAPNAGMTKDGILSTKDAILDGSLHCGSTNTRYIDIKQGEFHLRNGSHYLDIERSGSNIVIVFDEDSYIDGTGSGSGGGININSDKVVFSVDDLVVTPYRGSTNLWTGYTGEVITSLGKGSLGGICCNLRLEGNTWYWDEVSIGFYNSYNSNNVKKGLVVE